MENAIKVFCYGSNMSHKRLETRCPSSKFLFRAYIEGYTFKFNKKSNLGGGSGKGNIVPINNVTDCVWGVVFEIHQVEEDLLDKAEGLGDGGYNKTHIELKKENGETFEAMTYVATNPLTMADNELPFDWYKNHCLMGARQYDLPKTYIDYLSSFATKADSNRKRAREEMEIYI